MVMKKYYAQFQFVKRAHHFYLTLSGENILATSPIPTSANIVKVHKSDEDYAILYLHNEKPVKFEAGYDIKQVKELSKNGELV